MELNRRKIFGWLAGLPFVGAAIASPEDQGISLKEIREGDLKKVLKTYDPSLGVPKLEVQWLGDSLDFDPRQTIKHIVVGQPVANFEEVQAAYAFLRGEQWPDAAERYLKSRPVLVINKVAVILSNAVAASGVAGETPIDKHELDQAVAFIVRRNSDAQRFYNYMASTAVEEAKVVRLVAG